MQYTILGKTGLKVSRLGFGAMRLPMRGEKVDRDLAIPMIHRAFEGGVNFIDSAVGYCGSDSQCLVGEALKGWREKIVVSTKNHCYENDEKKWWQNLTDSLERLQVDSIDIYNTHGVDANKFENSVKPYILKWMEKARDQGMIRHICTSFHDKPEALRMIADSGVYESVILQYNMLNRELEDAVAYAKGKGMGIIAMGPVGGGRLGCDSEILSGILPDVKRVPELALRFVLANPNIDVALSGMSTMQHVVENLAIASDNRKLSPGDLNIINSQVERLGKMKDVNCTACNYCRPCSRDIEISSVLGLFNMARVYGLWGYARENYRWFGKKADVCSECGECVPKCPQKIAIPDELKRAHKALSGG